MLVAIVRFVQFALAVIVLGLSSYAVHVANIFYHDSPDTLNFQVFLGVWSLLVLLYVVGAPLVAPNYHHPYALLAIELATVVFWFSGWIAQAALFGAASCSSPQSEIVNACQCAKAVIAMGCFAWIAWCISLYFVIGGIRSGGRM